MTLWNDIKNACIEQGHKDSILPSIIMAQAILESGTFKSSLSQAPNHNLFGIKGSYKGQSVILPTREWSKEKGWYTVNASFRKYPSFHESIQDHNNLFINGLSWNRDFYRPVIGENSFEAVAKFLTSRYATDPNYWKKLMSIYETYDLHEMDKPQKKEEKKHEVNKSKVKKQYHKIVSGDTLGEIAKKYDVPLKVLAEFNDVKNVNLIFVGKILYIPHKHKVVSGDTLGELAKRSVKDFRAIARINKINNPNIIFTGQVIYI